MHMTQNSLYFCIVKIKKFKHIYVQKNIKVEQVIVNLYCQKVIRPQGLTIISGLL